MILGFCLALLIQTAQAQTWSGLKRLTWNSGLSSSPCIAADSGNGIHVVWRDYSPGNEEIFYKKSSDRGTTWLSAVRMTWDAAISSNPRVAADPDFGIHIVWAAYIPGGSEIFYKRSSNAGASWQASKRITWSTGDTFSPAVAVDTVNGVHIAWYDDSSGNFEIYYKKSSDGGTNWSSAKRLTWNAVDSIYPAIAINPSSGVHVVWERGNQGDWSAHEIFYRRSTDGGNTWQAVKRLTWNSGGSYSPSIATDAGAGIHIAWHDTTPGYAEIYYKKSTDNGGTWLALKRLTYNSGPASYASLATESNSKIHVVWHGAIPSTYEIFYKESTDDGASWLGQKRLTWNTGNSYYTSLASDAGNGIHVVWFDETPGMAEIYYRNRK